jgi:hypothetical protein
MVKKPSSWMIFEDACSVTNANFQKKRKTRKETENTNENVDHVEQRKK